MKNLSSSSLKEIDHEDELLNLSLSSKSIAPTDNITPFSLPLSLCVSPPAPPSFSNTTSIIDTKKNIAESRPPPRTRRTSTQSLKLGKSETIPPPYPWATSKRAMVHTLDYLISNGITNISGEVQCKKCEQQYQIQYDLQEKFKEIATFISKSKSVMHARAPIIWMNPNLPNCKYCNQSNCVKPVLSKKRSINWLFLLLGQMLGCCKLIELKYFCKHTKNHRTGAKDRVLYLTYLELCKQLDPEGPFDR